MQNELRPEYDLKSLQVRKIGTERKHFGRYVVQLLQSSKLPTLYRQLNDRVPKGQKKLTIGVNYDIINPLTRGRMLPLYRLVRYNMLLWNTHE